MTWFVLLLLQASTAHAGRLERVLEIEGTLSASDMKLPAGESADTFPIDLNAGDRVVVEMSSKKLDTYVVLKSPGGNVLEMDDTGGELGFSQLDAFVEESGTWLVYATSKYAGEKGKYSLVVSVDHSGTGSAPPSASGDGSPTPIASGETASGALGSGDPTLNAGEWYDLYTIELSAGDTLIADLRSTEFDTYVAVRTPSGGSFGNDDFEGDRNRSRVEQVVEESGTFTVFATTYAANQGGAYQLSVSTAAAGTGASDGLQRWSGTLASGDNVLSQGEFSDVIRLQGQAGERWLLDLRSSEFDPFLILRQPDGTQDQNDDFEGARDRSLLDVTLAASGEQAIGVTTYTAGQTGRYDLTLRRVGEGGTDAQEHRGTLASGDSQLDGGEWFDAYTFEGVPGQTVRIDLRGDYDTYLGLLGPTSFRVENDDGEGSGHSFVETVLTEAGTHRVVVTSYQPGQGGSYTLKMAFDQASQQSSEQQRDVALLQTGRAATGTLADGDLTLPTGEFQDVYALDVEAGQMITVELASTEFDPYVAVVLLDGSVVQNDDWQSRSDLARVEVQAPETGRYRVFATSYRVGATGAYSLTADVSSAYGVVAAAAPAEGGRTYGIFMGISDYPDDGPSDLDFTADDARALYDGMVGNGMRPEDGRLLVDGQATSQALLSAVSDLSSRMSEDDRLVLFYSGHGGRMAHEGGFQASDPDGFDETLALVDRQVTDDELAEMLRAVSRGTVLLVLDSCFSGGFSKDVISQPGRMGLFSSHEDVTSAVAAKFRAGGYLARFMVEAIGERRADDGDGALTALELSQYLYERYRSDVKSMPQDKSGSGAYDDIVMTGQNLGYQQIIVDRGGVGPSSVLFAW